MRSRCTIWQGSRNSSGYPTRRKGARVVLVTREVLAGALGRPIRAGYEAAHRCHVRACINPAHLVETTHRANCRMRNPNRRNGR
jgi:hypothetical protein